MALYAVSFRTAAAAATTFGGAGVAYWNLSPASTGRVRVREIGVFNTTATACAVGLSRTTARGTQSTTQVGTPQDAADAASLANFDSAWTVNPTQGAAAAMLRRAMIPAAIGGGIIWVFGPNELIAVSSNGIALVNPTGTGQVLDCWAVWEE